MRRLTPLLALTVAAVTFGAASPAGATTNPFGSKSPAQILALTSAAMARAGSVHVANETLLSGTARFILTADSATTIGTQHQQFGGGTEEVRLIGSTLFLRADTTAFSLNFNISNSTLANEWVRVPSGNANYATISSAILMPSLIRSTVQMTSLQDLGVKVFHGRQTVAVKGSPPNTTPGTSVTQTVYVSTAAPYLPVGLTTVFLEGVNGAGTSLFSRWGEKVTVASPSHYVTATSRNFP